MGKSITVTANDKGEYWLDVEVAGQKKKAIIDTGFTGTGGGGEVTVNKDNWDKIKDKLKNKQKSGKSQDYQGNEITPEHGKGTVKVTGLDTEVEKTILFSGAKDDLVGANFLHNLKDVTITWNLSDKKMTFTKADKPEEEPKDKQRRLDADLADNVAFYENAKPWIGEKYQGRYVVIAHGELVSVDDTYDQAIARSRDFESAGFATLVYRAGDELTFPESKFGVRTTDT